MIMTIFEQPLPEWATRFHFTHHSASGVARSDSHELFGKCYAKPNKIYDPPGCTMIGGICAENFAKDVLIKNMPYEKAMEKALAKFDAHKCQKHNLDDAKKHKIIRNEIYTVPKSKADKKAKGPPETGSVFELTLKHTLSALREATKGANKIVDGRKISFSMPGLELDFIGEMDVEALGGVIEIKTKWPKISKEGRGWNTNSLPSKLTGQFVADNVAQIGLYWAWLKKQSKTVPAKLIYANNIGYRIFSNADSEFLTDERFLRALEDMRLTAKIRENMMARSSNLEELFGLVNPDFSDWRWQNAAPDFLKKAKQLWSHL